MGRNKSRIFAKSVGSVAAPVPGCGHYGSSDGVQFYIALTLERVAIGVNQTGPIATFPQCAGAPMAIIEVMGVGPSERLHHQTDAVRAGGCSEEMDMIGHEHP